MRKISMVMMLVIAFVAALGLGSAFEDPWMNQQTSDSSISHVMDASQNQQFDFNTLPGGSNFTAVDDYLDGNKSVFLKPKMVTINNSSNHWQLWF